jgi:hypothetical protein
LESSVLISPNSSQQIVVNDNNSSFVTNTGFNKCVDYIEYKNGYKIFTFEFTLANEITEPGSYTVTVPAEMFYINSSVNSAYTCHYELVELNQETNVNKYCYEML